MVPDKVKTTDRRLFLKSLGWLASGALLTSGPTARALVEASGRLERDVDIELLPSSVFRRRRSVGAVAAKEGTVLVREPEGSRICALNRTGALIWDWIDGKRSVEQIAGLLQRRGVLGERRAYPHCYCFLMLLYRKGTLEL
jgi:hypothetical protein